MIEKIDWIKTIKYLSILGTIAICLFIFYLGWQDFFVDPDRLEERLRQMGAIAPIAFLAVQIHTDDHFHCKQSKAIDL